jgi:hypothetical protein
VRLAADVAAEPAARTALATGEVSPEHAQVIVRTLGGLPASVPSDVRGRAEALLLEWAHTFDAEAMSRLARRLQSRIADEWAARDELADAEDRAYAKRGLWLSEMGDGFVLRADLDHEVGAGLQAMIAACSRPHRTSNGERDPRSAPQRRADGLEHILRLAAASGQLPEHGGQRPGLVVTTDLATLQRRPDTAQASFEDGAPLSVDLLRRLACDAEVIPAVLGSRGEPLDLGRSARLVSVALRRALVLRDGGCAWPGCALPPAFCDAHHITHWADGGATSLANCVLLCRHHHRVAHKEHWAIQMVLGRPEFVPPSWVDPMRLPRRSNRDIVPGVGNLVRHVSEGPDPPQPRDTS